MREELALRYVPRRAVRRRAISNAAVYVELIAVGLKVYWRIYGG